MKIRGSVPGNPAGGDHATAKYLQYYAEAETEALPEDCGPFRHTLVIPVYNEPAELLQRLDALFSRNPSLLVILVINRPPGAVNDPTLHDALAARYPRSEQRDNLAWHRCRKDGALLVIDRFSAGRTIPSRQGVGLARKIGCDIACRLIDRGQITDPWIFCSDADTLWPADYFTATERAASSHSALSFRFAHCTEPGLPPLPTQLYEFSLHYYVLGLRHAASPYAHHSLGSSLAVHYQHYARVRGFPRRAAGEDFYLLNKLAKSAPIARLQAPRLLIRDRRSSRTPFGTGPARERISALGTPLDDYPLYHPQCFAELRRAWQWLSELAREPGLSVARWHAMLREKPVAGAPWLSALESLGTAAALEHATRHGRDPAGFHRHLTQWFDGFRTLKFVHLMREGHFPSLGLSTLLQQPATAQILPALPPLPTIDAERLHWLQRSNTILADRLFT